MILPKRAPVSPRVVSPISGEALPLEDEIRRLLSAGHRGLVVLVGEPGAGKTTALRHLAAVLPLRAGVLLIDDRDPIDARADLVIRTSRKGQEVSPQAAYHLARWGDDDVIEYLLAVHRDRCASVTARLRREDRALCGGLPELWGAVLDCLARDETIPDGRTALSRRLEEWLLETHSPQRVRTACLDALVAPKGEDLGPSEQLAQQRLPEGLSRALRHRSVQVLLAARQIAGELRGEGDCPSLSLRLPRDLVQAVGAEVGGDRRCLDRLRGLLAGPPGPHAMAASILHAAGASWAPQPGCTPQLRGAWLDGVAWPGAALAGADLAGADLTAADLREADLRKAIADKAALGRSRLAGALLEGVLATEADLAGADLARVRADLAGFVAANLTGASLESAVLRDASLIGANLTEAVFHRADLTRADLSQAVLGGADFYGADLSGATLSGLALREAAWTGASFRKAELKGCDLEGLGLPGANFEGANLEGAHLTGCRMPGANLDGALLGGAGLGDVDWEGASLRGADLRGATFHMGSSRSGLVGSPIACEGSRTGFYTDDYEEQHYKAPEEIRKANLCGADLRGALLDGVDFYLVDLRGTLYDAEHEDHFRRCGAILHSRVEE
jgi:uncharacterized protein YjbI with pentapeptide repeats